MLRRSICILLALLLLCSGALAQDMNSQLVRLHILAGDDSPEAQALKLELRDTCLKCAQACLWDAADADDAYMRLERHLKNFEEACRLRARELGYNGPIAAEVGSFDFPDRIYGALAVPAGEYRALRITIGDGGGHNWWCILYPSLCMLNEADAASDESNARDIWSWLLFRIGGKEE